MALRCGGCGAGFGPGRSDAPGPCPLCGQLMGGEMMGSQKMGGTGPSESSSNVKAAAPVDEDEYRSNVRELREELQRLRRGEAEAV